MTKEIKTTSSRRGGKREEIHAILQDIAHKCCCWELYYTNIIILGHN